MKIIINNIVYDPSPECKEAPTLHLDQNKQKFTTNQKSGNLMKKNSITTSSNPNNKTHNDISKKEEIMQKVFDDFYKDEGIPLDTNFKKFLEIDTENLSDNDIKEKYTDYVLKWAIKKNEEPKKLKLGGKKTQRRRRNKNKKSRRQPKSKIKKKTI